MDFLYRRERGKSFTDAEVKFFSTKQEDKKTEFVRGNEKIIVIGDLVSDSSGDELAIQVFDTVYNNKVYNLAGFFYIIYTDSNSSVYKIYSSLFNILPIYYTSGNDELLVSSKISLIKKFSGRSFDVDKRYILERTLFNYGFFNRTYWLDINLVPSNSFLVINNNLSIVKSLETENLFVDSPMKGKNVLENLSEEFVTSAKKYFMVDKPAVSFTSGFDGRTLVGVGKSLFINFTTYSFGNENSDDITFPVEQSEQLGIDHFPILLNDSYVKHYSFNCGINLIEMTEGASSFSRAHYLYSAKLLSEKFDYMITGNFGSELFRAFHNPGVMLSAELINFFDPSKKNWMDEIKNSGKRKFLQDTEEYKNEYEQLFQDLISYKKRYSFLDANKFLYVFLLEEVFKKYFGPEIVMQQNFLFNRSPFLDFNFIQALFRSVYAGVYSRFMTGNPFKRYKGQLLYAHIIKNTFTPLLYFDTARNYKPADIISFKGKFNLAKKYLSPKRIDSDDYSVARSFNNNKEKILGISLKEEYYNKPYIADCVSSGCNDIDTLINTLSSNYYLSLNENAESSNTGK